MQRKRSFAPRDWFLQRAYGLSQGISILPETSERERPCIRESSQGMSVFFDSILVFLMN